jgi:hypothetical protein
VMVYVPTSELRRPRVGEWFFHTRWNHYAPNGHNVVLGIDRKVIVRCTLPQGCPPDAEIYEPVEIPNQ